jgi:hypothetical protein
VFLFLSASRAALLFLLLSWEICFLTAFCGSLYFGAVANGFSVRSKKHEIAIPLSYNLSFASYPLQQGLLRQRFSSTWEASSFSTFLYRREVSSYYQGRNHTYASSSSSFCLKFVLYLGPKHSKKPQIERAIPWSIGRMLTNFEANRSVSSCLKVGGSGGQGIGRSLKAKVKETETTVSYDWRSSLWVRPLCIFLAF